MSGTPRLGLPFLSAGQAQKEFTHNEALQILDSLVSGTVEELPRSSPPASPAPGACYIVDSAPIGAWAGTAGCVAAWTSGGWRFIAAIEGMSLGVRTSGSRITFHDGVWENGIVRASAVLVNDQQIVGSRAPAIASPSGGMTVDNEARSTIDSILAALRQHGLIAT